MQVTMKIEGMSCNHCKMAATKALEAVSGVSAVEIDLEKGQAVVESETALSNESLTAAIDDAGYDVISIEG